MGKKTTQLLLAPRLYIPYNIAPEVKELAEDLSARWERYSQNFETTWRSFSREDRAKTLQEVGLAEIDSKYIPDWDLDVIAENPDVLLDILRHRATAKLSVQSCEGSPVGPSDIKMAERRMRESNIEQFLAGLPTAYTVLHDGDKYGNAYKAADHDTAASILLPRGKDHLCVPQATGEMVLMRQSIIFEALGFVILYIWEQDPDTQAPHQEPPSPDEALGRFLEALRLYDGAAEASAESLLGFARSNMKFLDSQWGSLGVRVGLLAGKVSAWSHSQPGMVADKDGHSQQVYGDRSLSSCLFDVVHNLAKYHAFWTYIAAVLPEVRGLGEDDGAGRGIILREIAHVCHVSFQRAQGVLKRHLQRSSGASWFERACDACDSDGNPVVVLKAGLDGLGDVRPPIHLGLQHVLRLCMPETTADAALEWLGELKKLCDADPDGMPFELYYAEAEALGEVATLLAFIRRLTTAVSLPRVDGKKKSKGLFVSKCSRTDKDLCAVRDKLDVTVFTVPLKRLSKPDVAAGALRALNDLCKQKTGASITDVYDKAVKESLCELKKRCAQAKASQKKGKAPAPPPPSAPAGPGLFTDNTQGKGNGEEQQKQQGRKEKVKTRPPEGAEEAPPPPAPAPVPVPEPEPKIKVSADAAAVFDVLFDRTQNRRPLAFTALESAMAELGFTIDSQGGVGSATMFTPPEGSGWRPITLHRPHGATTKIEGYNLLGVSTRFRNHFGWDADTFEIA